MNAMIASENIKNMIFTIRGVQVMLDSDLSKIYDVEVKRLTEQVKRNIDRFPENFRFQLTAQEHESLRCQIGTVSQNASPKTDALRSQFATLEMDNGRSQHRKYLPYVFTEQGVSAHYH